MEIEKPVLQQSSTDLLKCYHDLSFNSSLSHHHHHQDISKAEEVKKIDYITGNDNGDSVDSDNSNDNSNNRSYHLLLNEANDDEENDNDNESKSSSNTIFKQHFANFDVTSKEEEEEEATTTTVANLNYPELSSFQHRFSTIPMEITKRNHSFVACKLAQNSSNSTNNSNSINSIQEEIPEVEMENSQNLQEKLKHSVSSLYASSIIRQQNRRSVTLTTCN
ncbi:unnamed protein product [Brugia pahangi]|uniref:Serine/threonine-protein kinase DDB_G0282963 n=1 Tax=Brugia pahangi TaxID=6280 RepID=A0A0N4THJ6_BRUPA|nr:unnamed protein product [Brugia pahangi]